MIDRSEYLPVRTSLALLIQMRRASPERFAWRTEMYEFVSDPIAIDLLFGSDRERKAIEQGATWEQISREWESQEQSFRAESQAYWLY